MDSTKRFNALLISPNLGDYMTNKLALCLSENKHVAKFTLAGMSRSRNAGKNGIALARFESANFFGRILQYPAILFKIRKLLKDSDVVVSWSLDTSLLCALAAKFTGLKGKKFVYFYSDVHCMCTKKGSLISKILRFAECFNARHANVVAFTSPLYKSEYFEKIAGLKIDNYVLVENKVPKTSVEKVLGTFDPNNRDFSQPTIGYFGLLCYKATYKFMVKAAKSGIKTYFRGKFSPQTTDHIDSSIEYSGPYKNPDDLPEMYSKINMLYIIHDLALGTNNQWAMSNRFYDALMTQTPIVVQKGTANEKFVLENDIGISVDIYNPEESVKKLKAVKKDDLVKWHNNIARLAPHYYMLTDEYDRLFEKIM